MEPLLAAVLHRHGGLQQWQAVAYLEADLRFGGVAFAMRRVNRVGQQSRRVVVHTRHPCVVFDDYPKPGCTGIFTPDHVSIVDSMQGPIRQRVGPREALFWWRRQLWWDELDLLYFAGYALWNYLTTPFLLATPGVVSAEIEPWLEQGQTWRRLAVGFPTMVPTHSPRQVFYFDDQHLLRRQDYDPITFAPWARAANYCTAYAHVDGLHVPTNRYVVPRTADGKARSGPRLVWLDLEGLRLG